MMGARNKEVACGAKGPTPLINLLPLMSSFVSLESGILPEPNVG